MPLSQAWARPATHDGIRTRIVMVACPEVTVMRVRGSLGKLVLCRIVMPASPQFTTDGMNRLTKSPWASRE